MLLCQILRTFTNAYDCAAWLGERDGLCSHATAWLQECHIPAGLNQLSADKNLPNTGCNL